MAQLPRLILGDDAIFGADHDSEETARHHLAQFRDTSSILALLDGAHEAGVRTFMCTTHDRLGDVCEAVRAQPSRYPGLSFLPIMPFPGKYAEAVGEVGVLEAVRRFSTGGLMSTLLRGALGAITQDVGELMKLLVDAEMKRFDRLDVPVVFLQNVITDLVLGLKVHHLFRDFHRYVRDRYGAEAGFVTMNLPALLDALAAAGVTNPIVCATINPASFRMAGGAAAYEAAIRERRFRPVARGIQATGRLAPREAFDYVCRQRRIESLVVSASGRAELGTARDLVTLLDTKYAAPS